MVREQLSGKAALQPRRKNRRASEARLCSVVQNASRGVKGMDFLRQPVRPVHIVVVLVVLVAIIAGVWAWRQRTTRQQAEQAQQEGLQQMQREGTQY